MFVNLGEKILQDSAEKFLTWLKNNSIKMLVFAYFLENGSGQEFLLLLFYNHVLQKIQLIYKKNWLRKKNVQLVRQGTVFNHLFLSLVSNFIFGFSLWFTLTSICLWLSHSVQNLTVILLIWEKKNGLPGWWLSFVIRKLYFSF